MPLGSLGSLRSRRLHGRAGAVSAGEGRSVTALDVVHALPEALAGIRSD